MNALAVEGLSKRYPGFTLDRVSFVVPKGHIVGLIGRNGAGKSTTIKGILQLISSEGKVSVFGQDIRKNENAVKQTLGYVGGGFRFYPLKTLAAIRKAYSGFYPAFDQTKYEAYLARFGLVESKKVRELSEGMKVKFALALALSHGAKLLILDEPTSGLDPLSREEFCDIMLELVKNEGVSVLFSTHITSDLMRIADDIVYIAKGKVLINSALPELLSRYYLVSFPELQMSDKIPVIGKKAVKGGFEGLIERNAAIPAGFSVKEAALDPIMIHLEKEQEEPVCVHS